MGDAVRDGHCGEMGTGMGMGGKEEKAQRAYSCGWGTVEDVLL